MLLDLSLAPFFKLTKQLSVELAAGGRFHIGNVLNFSGILVGGEAAFDMRLQFLQ